MFKRYLVVLALAQALTAAAQSQTPPQPAPQKPAAPVPVSAEPQATSAVFGDWTLRCQRLPDGDKLIKLCEITGAIRNQNQDAIAQAIVSRALKTDPLKLTAQIPNNVLIPSVVRITFGENAKPWELGLRRVTQIGVFADLPLSDAQLLTLHVPAATGSLGFTDAVGRDVKLPLSLRGLPQALDALVRE